MGATKMETFSVWSIRGDQMTKTSNLLIYEGTFSQCHIWTEGSRLPVKDRVWFPEMGSEATECHSPPFAKMIEDTGLESRGQFSQANVINTVTVRVKQQGENGFRCKT